MRARIFPDLGEPFNAAIDIIDAIKSNPKAWKNSRCFQPFMCVSGWDISKRHAIIPKYPRLG
jgi:hypothetical protein